MNIQFIPVCDCPSFISNPGCSPLSSSLLWNISATTNEADRGIEASPPYHLGEVGKSHEPLLSPAAFLRHVQREENKIETKKQDSTAICLFIESTVKARGSESNVRLRGRATIPSSHDGRGCQSPSPPRGDPLRTAGGTGRRDGGAGK